MNFRRKRIALGVFLLLTWLCFWFSYKIFRNLLYEDYPLTDPDLVNITIAKDSVCQSGTKFAIAIHSAINNTALRQGIRETWGNSSHHGIPVVFIVGLNDNKDVHDLISLEHSTHGDLVVGDFVDTYRNLTWKHVISLKWFITYCPSANFLFKFDDDIFVQPKKLVSYIESIENKFEKPNILCDTVLSAEARRNKKSKWYVSRKEYRRKFYPTYCNGYAIIYPRNAVNFLLRNINDTQFFWIDDAFFTGLLAAMSNIPRFTEPIFIAPSNAYNLTEINETRLNFIATETFNKRPVGPTQIPEASVLHHLWEIVNNDQM